LAEKKIKPTFVELAIDLLDKDKIDNFLDFVKFLNEKQFLSDKQLASRSGSGYSRMIHYKKDKICALNLNSIVRYKPDGSWSICPNNIFFDDYDKYITDEKLKEFVLNSINFIKCRGCNGSQCMRGREDLTGEWSMSIFGRDFINVCSGTPLMIISPSGETLECAKELVLITQNIIADKLAR